MDVDYLRSREQISLINAREASSPEARAAHAGLARVYHEALVASRYRRRTPQASPGPNPKIA